MITVHLNANTTLTHAEDFTRAILDFSNTDGATARYVFSLREDGEFGRDRDSEFRDARVSTVTILRGFYDATMWTMRSSRAKALRDAIRSPTLALGKPE